jgi:hypothetical protein
MTQPLNTLPIEEFLNRARVAIKGNQKDITLTIKEVTDLQNSLSVVMTRLAGDLDKNTGDPLENIEIKITGGSF